MQVGNNNIAFRSHNHNLTNEQREILANVSDNQLKDIASAYAAVEFHNDPTREIAQAASIAIPVANTMTVASLTPGSLGAKMVGGASKAKDWSLLFVAYSAINKAFYKLVDKIPPLKRFSEDHPAATAVGSTLGTVYLALAGVKTINKNIEKSSLRARIFYHPQRDKFIEKINGIRNAKITNEAANVAKAFNTTIDNIKMPDRYDIAKEYNLAKETIGIKTGKYINIAANKFKKLVNKIPGKKYLTKGSKIINKGLNSKLGRVLNAAAYIGLIGLMVKSFSDIGRAPKTAETTYRQLKDAKYEAKIDLLENKIDKINNSDIESIVEV